MFLQLSIALLASWYGRRRGADVSCWLRVMSKTWQTTNFFVHSKIYKTLSKNTILSVSDSYHGVSWKTLDASGWTSKTKRCTKAVSQNTSDACIADASAWVSAAVSLLYHGTLFVASYLVSSLTYRGMTLLLVTSQAMSHSLELTSNSRSWFSSSCSSSSCFRRHLKTELFSNAYGVN